MSLVSSVWELEVSERFMAEEERIKDRNKMCDQYGLLDAGYKRRLESFHWDLGQCVEGRNGALLYGEDVVYNASRMEV